MSISTLTDAPVCERCGSPLEHDQEWCLECGVARTLIRRPPDWRVPIAVIGIVILLVGAAFAIALINLSSDANRAAAQSAATTIATSGPPASTTAAAAIAGWAPGLPGWTVVLATSTDEAAARQLAVELASRAPAVGLLDSSQHPALKPGLWIVFSGRYPTDAGARTAAAALRAKGILSARVRLVARAGA